ncbi:hypothetical protein TNCV_2187141 [Trichonephila clavipes]|nr:hypothetical protein TNCV_2187141 [Trichonephila clavipes]
MPDRPLAGAPPDTCAVVISTETESGFITEDDTSPVCHTQVARGRQNPVDTAYDVGSVVSVLADVGSSSQLRSVVSPYGFLLMAPDVWKEKIPEGFELANMVTNDAKLAANLVSKNDANVALPPKFRQVLIESPF